jgi:hypothetical protein
MDHLVDDPWRFLAQFRSGLRIALRDDIPMLGNLFDGIIFPDEWEIKTQE